MFDTNFNSTYELMQVFSTEEACIKHMEMIRWKGIVKSPFDADSKVYKCKKGYRCKNTGKYFNVKTGTMFENTKIPMQKWFLAIWLVASHKKGITSTQLAKDIGVSQTTAWFLAHRIRVNFGIENKNKLKGVVECDETFVGGKNKNRHKDKKVAQCQGRSFKDKTPVLGMLQRAEKETIERPHKLIPDRIVKEVIITKESQLIAIVINNTQKETIQPLINQYIEKDSIVLTDEWKAYKGLNYEHKFVDHSCKEYVNLQDNNVHTNNIEGSWNILKKSVSSMYNHVSNKHLQKYVDEFVFRYNLRNVSDHDKFRYFLLNSNIRIRYKDLIKQC